MINNKGFIFIETIVTTVVLITTLIVLYSTYSSAVLGEKERLYYDNISYVYKTNLIADIVAETRDLNKWNEAVDEALSLEYAFVFNFRSPIFSDNTNLEALKENVYDFRVLIYVPFDQINNLKNCVKTKDNSDQKCQYTLNMLTHGDKYIIDYLSIIDVPTSADLIGSDVKGILIGMFYENKAGGPKVDNYNLCLGCYACNSYSSSGKCTSYFNQNNLKKTCYYNDDVEDNMSSDASEDYNNSLKEYKKDDKKGFNMLCENAYYISWVYMK